MDTDRQEMMYTTIKWWHCDDGSNTFAVNASLSQDDLFALDVACVQPAPVWALILLICWGLLLLTCWVRRRMAELSIVCPCINDPVHLCTYVRMCPCLMPLCIHLSMYITSMYLCIYLSLHAYGVPQCCWVMGDANCLFRPSLRKRKASGIS